MRHRCGIARPLVSPASWLAAGLLLLSGCGGRFGELTGKVTFQDKLVRMGSVLVVGKDGVPRSTTIQDDGSFAVGNVPAGQVRIAVTSPDPLTVHLVPPKHGTPPPPPDRSRWFPIPAKYADFKESELVFTVRGGSNLFDIKLK
jgi:hypothetical protein